MMAAFAFDAGKTPVKVAAVRIFINNIQYIRPPIPIRVQVLQNVLPHTNNIDSCGGFVVYILQPR